METAVHKKHLCGYIWKMSHHVAAFYDRRSPFVRRVYGQAGLTRLAPPWARGLCLKALNCFTFDDKLVEDSVRACQIANGRRA